MTGIQKAVEAAGGQGQLGAKLDPPISQQAVSKMVAKGFAPIGRAREIAKLFDIPLRELVDPALVEAAEQ